MPRGIVINELLDPKAGLSALQSLKISDASHLVPSKDDLPTKTTILVDVKAGGCNFFDILMTQGKYQTKPPLPFVMGCEFCGVVSYITPEASLKFKLKVGDRVAGSSSWGAFCDTVAIEAALVQKIPDSMSFTEGAGFTMTYFTSYYGLVYRAQIKPGETVLVHAAAGGVGSAAVQIAKSFGCKVIATVGSNEKAKAVKEMLNGADYVINYTEQKDWISEVKKITKGKGADVIYDPVGGDIFIKSLKVAAWNGRLLVIGFAGGTIPKIPANLILLKNVSVVGVFFGAFCMREPKRAQVLFKEVFDLYERGQLKPLIYKVLPLGDISEALRALGSRETFGKVVLSVDHQKSNSKL
eukprot:TRINITY_DN3714_c0_g1_i1.p1 TRINITY_DN3714_c0_g1~~TRINITY_DN3714_c0_g1_i1.p1  ORF type:complete len:364 (-),score=108.82 TRINITY_DN3714_c0_g1_i1:22-1083(-)